MHSFREIFIERLGEKRYYCISRKIFRLLETLPCFMRLKFINLFLGVGDVPHFDVALSAASDDAVPV